jgi:hypothetical protein
MNAAQERRAKDLVKELKDAGHNCGLLLMQGQVVLRLPGSPYSDAPLLPFEEDDLNNALSLGLVEKRSMVSNSGGWDWYVLALAK